VSDDLLDVASYSYDPIKRELVSYDTPEIARIKAVYVRSTSLGGCMFWEVCVRDVDAVFSSPNIPLAVDRQDGLRIARSDRRDDAR
jgi:GH18 family chitinase